MSFTNLYYKRVAGTARPCYICCKPTTTVLATLNTTDFLYTCPAHLTDRGFTTPLGEAGDGAQGTRKLGLSPEEVAKVKEEWEEQQKRKSEKGEKEKEGVKKEEDKDKSKDKEEKQSESVQDKSANKTATGSGASSPPTTLSHERYTLHRDYFASLVEALYIKYNKLFTSLTVRLAEHRKRRQAAQAKELGPRLPSAPSSMPT